MSSTVPWVPNRYPPARRTDHTEVYKSATRGDVRVPDPYVWLEDATAETEAWVDAQERFTRAYLDQLPDRERLEKAIRANTDYARFSAPSLRGEQWYWYYNSGLQAQSTIYRSADKTLPAFSAKDEGPGGEAFFDVNLLSEDGTAALATSAFSRDGKFFAYGVSRSGSDFCTIYVRSKDAPLVQTGDKRPSHDDDRLPDELRFVKFSGISWTGDSKGFFYQRFPDRASHGDADSDAAGTETNVDLNAALYYHRVGTPQSEDVLIKKDDAHPTYMWGVYVSEEEDGRWLKLSASKDTARKNLLWVADLHKTSIGPEMEWTPLVTEFDAAYYPVAHDGETMLVLTNKDAPQYKLAALNVSASAAGGGGAPVLRDVVREDPDAVLKDALAVHGGPLLLVYQRAVQDELYEYTRAGERVRRLAEAHVGTISVSGKQNRQTQAFATLAGFTTPGTVVTYDLGVPEKERKVEEWRATVLRGLDPAEFSAEQVWYASADGTRVPMFVVRHKNTPRDGTAPAIQYGYGGFDISVTPAFTPHWLTFCKHFGGLCAVANIRGGGEFGEAWHEGGMRENKTNCFDEFIAATRFLEEEKIAGKGKVAINGGSNGGLLVAACVNRAPAGTFGAAVAEVGVHDYLKFHRFTIGRAWTADFGDPDEPADFDFMEPISPVHNVPRDRALPPTLLLTADHDDRVVPLHSFKLAAALQHARPQNAEPLLLRVEKKAGHGAGKSTEQRVKEQADKWAFVANVLGLKWRD